MSDTALPPLGKIVMDASKILLAVNHKRISLAAFLKMAPDAAKYVDASGCTALTEPPHFEAGRDSRGYDFSAVKLHGQWRIIAGCRNFCLSDARKHWGSGGRSDRPDCAALVEKLALAIGG